MELTHKIHGNITQVLSKMNTANFSGLMSSLSTLLGGLNYSVNIFLVDISSGEHGNFLDTFIENAANDSLNGLPEDDRYRQNVNVVMATNELPGDSFWLLIGGRKVGYMTFPRIDRVLKIDGESGNPFGISHAFIQEFIDTKFALLNAMEAAELLTELALYDPLTGLGNRRKLIFTSDHVFGNPKHKDELTTLGTLMIDIDNFKHVNDKYGHPIGDLAIQAIVSHLAKAGLDVKHDMVARLGGEEFAVIFRGITEKEIKIMAEKIRASVDDHKLVIRGEHAGSLISKNNISEIQENCIEFTISIGATLRLNYKYSEESFEADRSHSLGCADGALYRSKEGGRNRVTFQEDIGEENDPIMSSGDRRHGSRTPISSP